MRGCLLAVSRDHLVSQATVVLLARACGSLFACGQLNCVFHCRRQPLVGNRLYLISTFIVRQCHMHDSEARDSRIEPTDPRHSAGTHWLRWAGAVAFLVLIIAGGLEWRVVWCAHHNYCKPTEVRNGHIRTVDDPKQDQPEAVGFAVESEEGRLEYAASTGPLSFAVSNGVLAIADTVKQRVAVFDADTLKYEKSIDKFNFPPQRINLSGDILLVRARFGLSDNDAICSVTAGSCTSLADVSLDEVKKLRVQEEALARTPEMPVKLEVKIPNLISVTAIGRDRAGNLYVLSKQGSGDKNAAVSIVLKYSPQNLLVATSPPIPADEGELDVLDRLRVDENGTCYAFFVKQEDVQIWRWVTHNEN